MWRACLVLVAACGTSSAPTPAPARTGSAAPRVAWQECTEAARARMEKALVAREGLERLDAEGGEQMPTLTCVTMQLGHEPGFFVELVGRRGRAPVRLHGVVALDGTTELIPIAPAAARGVQIPRAMVYFETIDLDGDGTDDLIAHRRDPRLPRAEWIDVIAVRGRTLVDIEGPPVAHEDPDVDEACTGTLSETRAGSATHLVVAVSASTGESEHCLATGRHELALTGDRLVEVATR
ncbi:MAG: hypothetical protein JO257_28255 [Deltaproteobacteria bacterium]|nr:hypothetical protein [Deltaproteobacteria bacterium]